MQLWDRSDLPPKLVGHVKPNMDRLDNAGQPFETWVRFDALESYLMDLITELDQRPCEPLDLAAVMPWLATASARAPQEMPI